nr:hypothetical protein [Nanoarchaeum sp.]
DKLVEIPKGRRILDIGCSSGNVTIRYARKAQPGSYILGVDIDSELIGVANGYLGKESAQVRDITRFVDLPVEDIHEEPESFDTITATEFFEHIVHSEHQRIMEHSLKFLKQNGSMIISVPNRFPNEKYVEEKRYRWDWHNHYTHFTKKSLEHFLQNYFEEVRFHSVYNEAPEEGIFLIAEGVNKKC